MFSKIILLNAAVKTFETNFVVTRQLFQRGAFPKAVPVVKPGNNEYMTYKDSEIILRQWISSPSTVLLPKEPMAVFIDDTRTDRDPQHLIGYEILFSQLRSHDNFLGPAGFFKWTVFMSTAYQLMDKAFFTQSFLSKTFHNWKGDKDFFKSLEWKIDSAFLNWLQTLRLDAYISLCLATDSLDDVAGDENQVKVAKAVDINHLSTLYHAISMLGYKNILKYSLVKESTNTFELTLLVLEMLRMGIPRSEIDPVLNHLDFHSERIQMLKKIKDKHFPGATE